MTRSRLILLATVTLFAISPAFAVDYNYTDDGTNETDARPPPSPPSINAPVDVRKNTNAPVNAPLDVRNNAPVNAPVNVRKNTTTTTDSRAVTNTDTKVNNARKESGTAKAVNGPSTSSTGPSTSGPSTSSTGPIQFQPTINVQMHSAPVNVQNTNPITLSNTSQNTNPNNLSNTSSEPESKQRRGVCGGEGRRAGRALAGAGPRACPSRYPCACAAACLRSRRSRQPRDRRVRSPDRLEPAYWPRCAVRKRAGSGLHSVGSTRRDAGDDLQSSGSLVERRGLHPGLARAWLGLRSLRNCLVTRQLPRDRSCSSSSRRREGGPLASDRPLFQRVARRPQPCSSSSAARRSAQTVSSCCSVVRAQSHSGSGGG